MKPKEIIYKIINYRDEKSNVPSQKFEVYEDGELVYANDYKIITFHPSVYIQDYEDSIKPSSHDKETRF